MNFSETLYQACQYAQSGFDSEYWVDLIKRMVVKNNFSFAYDDIDDAWIHVSAALGQAFIFNRNFPFVIALNQYSAFPFQDYLGSSFKIFFVKDWDKQLLSLDLSRISERCMQWRTEAVSPESFTVLDLIYATH